MIAVTFALPAESSAFVRLLQNREDSRKDPSISGTLHGKSIGILHTGVGERAVHERLGPFLARRSPHLLISSGFTGGLIHELQLGAIFLAENFSEPEFRAAAVASLAPRNFRVGKLITSTQIAHTPAERADLARTTGALAVDMETEFIAQECARRSIPMLSLRIITDTPGAPFPVPPQALFDIQRQRTNLASLLLYLATHPAAIPRFGDFVRQVRSAAAVLSATLESLIRDARFSG